MQLHGVSEAKLADAAEKEIEIEYYSAILRQDTELRRELGHGQLQKGDVATGIVAVTDFSLGQH